MVRLVPTAPLALAFLTACALPRADGAEHLLDAAWPAPPQGPVYEVAAPAPIGLRTGARAPSAEPAVWTLDAVLARIAEANPSVAVARARLEEASAMREEAGAAYLPVLTLGLEAVRSDDPSLAFGLLLRQERLTLGPGFDPTPGQTENWRKEARLDWALFAPGRAQMRGAARAGEEAARLGAEAVERRLLNAGVQAWLGLRAARALAAVERESVGVVERRLEETRVRQREGAALRADVLRLEVRLAAARQAAAQADGDARAAEAALDALMGRGNRAADPALVLAEDEVAIGEGLPAGLDALLAAARSNRRDLQAAAFDAERHARASDAARAERLPVLGAFAAYDVDGPEPAFDGDLDSTTIGLGLHLPLSFGTGARIRQARARELGAREELRRLALDVAREVRDAQDALAVAGERLALAEASIGAAEEAWRIVAAAQDAGAATVTDVLAAQDERRQARARLVVARAGVQLARAQLVAAIGGVR